MNIQRKATKLNSTQCVRHLIDLDHWNYLHYNIEEKEVIWSSFKTCSTTCMIFLCFQIFTLAPINCVTRYHQIIQVSILGSIHLVEEWLTVGITCQGIADATPTIAWSVYLINLIVANVCFVNCVCMQLSS